MRMWGHRCSKASFSVRKVAKCNFKSKAQLHEKYLSNEMNCFLQCRRQIFMSLSFFAEKVIFRAKCTKYHFFRASKNTNSVFSANKQLWELRPQMLKSFFLSQKKLLNAILRAKLNYMKNILSNEMNCFLQCRRQIFMSLSFLQKKSFLSLNAQKSLL